MDKEKKVIFFNRWWACAIFRVLTKEIFEMKNFVRLFKTLSEVFFYLIPVIFFGDYYDGRLWLENGVR